MKRLCCSKLLLLLVLQFVLFGASVPKSAIFYYGKDISYPMVGVHDYIFVDPTKINEYRHGFELYNDKIYAKVPVSSGYQKVVERLLTQGYKNFYFIVKDKKDKSFISFVKQFHQQHPNAHIALEAPKKIVKKSKQFIDVVVFDGGLKKDINVHAFYKNGLEVIDKEHPGQDGMKSAQELLKIVRRKGMIPYISSSSYQDYGLSAKTAIKREIFTIIDEDKVDRIISSAHQYGAMPLEYMGYIQHIHNVSDPLPDVEDFATRYKGVVVWLSTDTKKFQKLFSWLLEVKKKGIPIAFASNFGFVADGMLLSQFGIETSDATATAHNKKKIVYRDSMVGFETEPQINDSTLYLHPKNAVKPLLTYQDQNHGSSTPAAIMPWGGYAVFGSFLFELDDNNLWVVNPFEFFKEALRLEPIPVPDVTTENGKRVMFTHIDGDGIMNGYESGANKYSGEMIYERILKKFKLPHSVSVIGAEIAPNGLYPKISKDLMNIARKMYALDNVEPATHTFTHTFKWDKITKDGDLDPKYRLDPKGYKYSLYNELQAPLTFIEKNLLPRNSKKKAQTVFWSGDCSPRVNALSFIYKHHLLNINGGYTTINNMQPWLTLVSPLGIERGGYYQIFTGAQNENVYTNDWLGPFWGYKKVVQTFKMTDKPRRLKPIDVYYHLYSGSKIASLNALKYVFNWVLKQDIRPIYTSEYIPKVMDFYEVSLAKVFYNEYYVAGLKDLKTLRVNKMMHADMEKSTNLLGERSVGNDTYIHLAKKDDAHIVVTKSKQKDTTYLVSTNAEVQEYFEGRNAKRYTLKGYVDLRVQLHLKPQCSVTSKPRATKVQHKANGIVSLQYKNQKKAVIDVLCR